MRYAVHAAQQNINILLGLCIVVALLASAEDTVSADRGAGGRSSNFSGAAPTIGDFAAHASVRSTYRVLITLFRAVDFSISAVRTTALGGRK